MLPDVDPQLLARIRTKMKQKPMKDQVKRLVANLSKADLQNRSKVRTTFMQVSRTLKEPISERQLDMLTQWLIAQRIDPTNPLHLLRLWGIFR